ncbi:MAG TPA: hypothetical protein VL243_17170 [Vicinamibacterales bacterium]|jgi:hypothetical protein|nr:hypothetical protein [Vicinamibacterales bacterium]
MRFPIAVTLSLLGFGLFLAGCSEQGSASQGSDVPVTVNISSLFLTVKNQAGVPLTDVTISIVPPTRTTVYTKFFGRLENSEARDVMLGDFSGRDGTPFSLRVVKPKTVEVKGTGADGKTYEVSVPWRQ